MKRPQGITEAAPGLWRILRRFSPYIRKERTLIAGSFIALFAEISARLLEPWPLKFVLDRVLGSRPSRGGWHIAILERLNANELLTVAAIATVVFSGTRALADYLNTVGFALVGNRVLSEIRYDLYRRLQCLSLSFHSKARGGDLTIRIMSDIGVLTDVAVNALLPLLGGVLVMIGMAAFMLWLNWELGLIAMAAFPLFWLATVRLSRRIVEASQKQRKREGAMAATAAETIGAIKLVQALSLENTFAQSFSDDNRQSLNESIKASRLTGSLGRTLDFLIAIVSAIVLWLGARMVLRDDLTTGDLVIFFTYLKNTFRPLKDFAKYSGRLARAAVAGERAINVLHHEPEVQDLPGAVSANPFRGAIRFREVSFWYEPERRALDKVSLEIDPGQQIALLGHSGGGKSTLVSLILRLYDPQNGTISIDGHDIREYTLESLRSQISIVLQDSVLFAASVRDNIAYGAPNVTDQEIEAAARLANAHEFIEALPDGYDTFMGERGLTLSGGQRQRIAIARAAVRKAPILILDEPTTGLDRENGHAVIEALERLAHGHTAFLITHDLQLAANADRIVYLEDGRIVEFGTHDELVVAGGRYAAMLRLQDGGWDKAAERGTARLAR